MGGEIRAPRENRDALVAKPDQMPRSLVSAAKIICRGGVSLKTVRNAIETDDREAAAHQPVERNCRIRARNQNTVDTMTEESVELLLLLTRIFVGIAKHYGVIRGACDFFRAYDHFGEERGGDVRDNHPQHLGPAGFQAARNLVGMKV